MFSTKSVKTILKGVYWYNHSNISLVIGQEDEKFNIVACKSIAISPSFPYFFLYTRWRSSNASPLPDTFSFTFFLRYCGWWRFSLTVCTRIWWRSKQITSSAVWLAVTTPEFSTTVFCERYIRDSKSVFVVLKHHLKNRVHWRTFETGKNTRMIGFVFGKVLSGFCKKETFFGQVF